MLIRLRKEYFLQMKAKIKRLEVRVAYPNLKGLKIGSLVTFESGRDRIVVKIKDVRRYETFSAMLDKEDYRLIVEGKTKEEILNIFHSIYPPNKEALGVLVLEVTLLS